MSEKKASLVTTRILIFVILASIVYCCFTFLLQYLVFPNFSYIQNEKILIATTPHVNTSIIISDNSLPSTQVNIYEGTSIPGVFALGMVITISGTGNEGLRMRSSAGIDQNTEFLAQEGEKLLLTAGPEIKDGLIWWKIESLDNPTKTGWSVQDFMVVK